MNGYDANRWRSDDPEIFMEPVDLFQEQDRGLPENCGKKDRKTTLQAYFTCHPCQCDLMSIVTLRSHVNGRKHQIKELQQKLKHMKNEEKKKEESGKDEVSVRVRSRSPAKVPQDNDVKNKRKRKKDHNDNQAAEESNVKLRKEVNLVISQSPVRVSLEEENLTRFHHKVGQAVMAVMNQYWPGAQEFTGVRKIRSEEEYCNTARYLSHDIREKIKEGYRAFNRNSLEAISFTGDHALVIQTEVESFFEGRPVIS